MNTYLKIKIKSLAAEARIIRAEEKKWPGGTDVRAGLYHHRVHAVRKEARDSLVAYGFLRKRTYRRVETNPKTQPNWENVKRIIIKFAPDLRMNNSFPAEFDSWREAV